MSGLGLLMLRTAQISAMPSMPPLKYCARGVSSQSCRAIGRALARRHETYRDVRLWHKAGIATVPTMSALGVKQTS
jgi:hypothetical protein